MPAVHTIYTIAMLRLSVHSVHECVTPSSSMDLQGDDLVRYGRHQLFSNCTLCPTGAKARLFSFSHQEVSLVYFSTFEPIELTPDSIMQQAGVPTLYDSASNQRLPCLYCSTPWPTSLGAPLIPCFTPR